MSTRETSVPRRATGLLALALVVVLALIVGPHRRVAVSKVPADSAA